MRGGRPSDDSNLCTSSSMSGFMWRESLPFGSYKRTLRGKVLEPMSRSSHEVCSGRCHHRTAGNTVRSPLHAPARHTTRLTPRGGGLRVSRAPGGAPPARAAPLATATGPAPRSCGGQTRSPSSANSTLMVYKLTVDGLTAKNIIWCCQLKTIMPGGIRFWP
jgi:hypothetical protein